MNWEAVLVVIVAISGVWVRMEVKVAQVQRDVQWIRSQLSMLGFTSPGNH